MAQPHLQWTEHDRLEIIYLGFLRGNWEHFWRTLWICSTTLIIDSSLVTNVEVLKGMYFHEMIESVAESCK